MLPIGIRKVFWCSSGCHSAVIWSWWHLCWCRWRGGWRWIIFDSHMVKRVDWPSGTSSWGWKMVVSAGFAVYDCSWWWFCSDRKIVYVGISIRCTCGSCRLRLKFFCHEKWILVTKVRHTHLKP
jgi:hypothetical protein